MNLCNSNDIRLKEYWLNNDKVDPVITVTWCHTDLPRGWWGKRKDMMLLYFHSWIGLWKRNVVQNTTSPSLPGAAHLGGVSYTMLAEAAFPLKPDPMRPDPGQNLSHNKRIFN